MSCWSFAYFSSEKAYSQDFDIAEPEFGFEESGDEEFYPAEPLFEAPDDPEEDNGMEIVEPLPAPTPPPRGPRNGRFSRPNFGGGASPPPARPQSQFRPSLPARGSSAFGRTLSGDVQFRKTGEAQPEEGDSLSQKKLQLQKLKEKFQETFQ